MRNMSTNLRIAHYADSEHGRRFPDSVPQLGTDNRIYGFWVMGQDYRSKSGYYGSYPPRFLDRVFSFFPDVEHEEVMHLFSGSLPEGTKGLRVDVNPKLKPDIVADAEKLSDYFAESDHPIRRTWKLIIAGPPYSIEDAEHYGTVMIKQNVVMRECSKVLAPGGWIVWLDQVWPMFSKKNVRYKGSIGIQRSTNHRFRVVTFYRKRAK